ncbi:hypothetical protein K1719_045714 [Acacia pycnantha]|nr:hypothetical protein K1719_045714 [Acacia pycnantha]
MTALSGSLKSIKAAFEIEEKEGKAAKPFRRTRSWRWADNYPYVATDDYMEALIGGPQFESMGLLCRKCGRVGHLMEGCERFYMRRMMERWKLKASGEEIQVVEKEDEEVLGKRCKEYGGNERLSPALESKGSTVSLYLSDVLK